jgi:hypothetical protein
MPTTTKPEDTPTPEEEGLSKDARDSTYEKAPEDKDAGFPPPGPGVIQTLGKPKEAS